MPVASWPRMRPSKKFQRLLATVIASSTSITGCSSGSPGELVAASGDGGTQTQDGGRDGSASINDCRPPPPQTLVVQMAVEFCADAPLGLDAGAGADASTADAAACAVNCYRACDEVFPVGGCGESCERKSATEVECKRYYCCGRATEGFVGPARAGDLGSLFAAYARLEAAAVVAFERMARELEAQGASDELIRDARRAANDERRHTRMMTALARRRGHDVDVTVESPSTVRTFFEIVLENAVEGCVRETFGALLAIIQSDEAPDPELRRAMKVIARDEVAHAELSWRIAAALEPRLSSTERALVHDARLRAFAELELESDLPLWRESGQPAPERARGLARASRNALARRPGLAVG